MPPPLCSSEAPVRASESGQPLMLAPTDAAGSLAACSSRRHVHAALPSLTDFVVRARASRSASPTDGQAWKGPGGEAPNHNTRTRQKYVVADKRRSPLPLYQSCPGIVFLGRLICPPARLMGQFYCLCQYSVAADALLPPANRPPFWPACLHLSPVLPMSWTLSFARRGRSTVQRRHTTTHTHGLARHKRRHAQ